jgi:Flp pilus assembly pilin Flp
MSHLLNDDQGQDVAEYGLLVAGVGLLVLLGTASLGSQLHDWFAVLATRIISLVGV